MKNAGDGVDQRRFAGAVGADDREDLAAIEVERDAFECGDLFVVDLNLR